MRAAFAAEEKIPKPTECLLFAIYHFAVLSLTEEECAQRLTTSLTRASLLQSYNHATRQALANASFLQSTDFTVLQALTLYLLSTKQTTPPQTFWVLTGAAIRIAQQIGLHRDGTHLSLPPFEVQMRRRLWYQILPLDMWAGHMTGTGIAVMPESWNTKAPWNVNDTDIWPGMSTIPADRKGATEMMFCLGRATLGRAFGAIHGGKGDVESTITAVQSEVEDRFLRYCDVVEPLHFLTVCSARSGVCAMRLRHLLGKMDKNNGKCDEQQRKEMLRLTQKIVDTDSTACSNSALKRFEWHIGGLFVWGSWESLVFNLQMLKQGELVAEDRNEAWKRVEDMFANHPGEMLRSKRALHVAIRRLVLKAWEKNPLEPGIQSELVSTVKNEMSPSRTTTVAPTPDLATSMSTESGYDIVSGQTHDAIAVPTGIHDFDSDKQFDFDPNFDLDAVDWSFWNQLIQDNQTVR